MNVEVHSDLLVCSISVLQVNDFPRAGHPLTVHKQRKHRQLTFVIPGEEAPRELDQMAPLDDTQDKIEHERSTEEDEDIDFGDLSHPDALNTQRNKSPNRHRLSILVPPSMLQHCRMPHIRTFTRIQGEPSSLKEGCTIGLSRKSAWTNPCCYCQGQLAIEKGKGCGRKVYGGTKDIWNKHESFFNYLKGKSSEGDAVEIMYQIERLMERVKGRG